MTTEYLNNKVFERIIERYQSSKKNKAKYKLILEDYSETITRKKSKNVDFTTEEKKFKEIDLSFRNICHEHLDSQKELATAFYTLSENIVRYAKFNLIDIDDAVQEGVMICFEKIETFDPDKGKAFNYMTTCILNHFRQLWRTARSYNDFKRRYHDYLQKIHSSSSEKQRKRHV